MVLVTGNLVLNKTRGIFLGSALALCINYMRCDNYAIVILFIQNVVSTPESPW